MCPDKDKKTGMAAFNFNIKEVMKEDSRYNSDDEISWFESEPMEPEWTKKSAKMSYLQFLVVKYNDGEESL
jgi:hypothetical protein